VKLTQIRNSGPIKLNRWKHTKDKQLITEQLSNGYTKASGIEDNNDSSKSTTLTLLHSWTKLKSKVKKGHHRHNKRDKKRQKTNRLETDKWKDIQHRRIQSCKVSMNIIQAIQNMSSTQFSSKRELKVT